MTGAAGIICRPALLADLPPGALYVLGDDAEGVIQQWSEFGQTIHLRGRGRVLKAGADLRVTEIRVVHGAHVVPMEG